MPRPISLFLALAVALMAPAVHAAEPATHPPALPSSLRDRLDRLALHLPGDTLSGEIVRSVEETPEGAFWCDELTPEAEARRAADAHERLLDCRPALVTPPAAQRVFDRLVAELPAHLKPDAFHYRLTVLDRPGREAFTTGGGLVYLTSAETDDWLADPDRGEAALAFILAGEIAHDALGHTRRGWEWHDAVEETAGLLPFPEARKVVTAALGAARRADSPTRPPNGRPRTASLSICAATPASIRTPPSTPSASPHGIT